MAASFSKLRLLVGDQGEHASRGRCYHRQGKGHGLHHEDTETFRESRGHEQIDGVDHILEQVEDEG